MQRFLSSSIVARLVFVMMFSLLFLTACATAGQGFVELPGDAKAGITAVLLVGVSFVFAKLITLIPLLKFLESFREPLAFAIAAELIGFIQNIVPDAYGAIAILGVQLVLAILAVFGVANELKRRNVRGFR